MQENGLVEGKAVWDVWSGGVEWTSRPLMRNEVRVPDGRALLVPETRYLKAAKKMLATCNLISGDDG